MPHPNPLPPVAQEPGAQRSQATQCRLDAYLASALTGLDADQRKYLFEISDAVAATCADNNVRLYEPRKVTDPVHHTTVPDVEVFRTDRHRVINSDLLIYLAHHPSTGAGQELVFAQEAIVPILVIAHIDTRISRMVTGIPGPLTLVRYDSITQLTARLEQEIVDLQPKLLQRRIALEELEQHRVGTRIRELRELRNMTRRQVAESTRIPNAFTPEQLKQWEQSSDKVNNLSLTHLQEIASALSVSIKDLV
ncbi:helix-turn-helix domain-containing protein [Streptomyces turgidiscabies]|uniref:Toxin-antitoxin system, antitoxin component, Xre family n=1 Tax=Streptomyces turgidiscabies (strain Car8) TaxID=698760 RepID=L7EUI3_STRT8|nr:MULTISPECIES: helix-turn-helix transcriptional regulator [Streptomyces]ELP62687.1 toxin-antitoxin system, antitoxin component, Xre family [Streptomyces turgidiscabies Car8]MDX3492460.1 helix-turn-helix transcriptional regulator [Streptomyces turgidiscabies]GAQ69246.1 anaerobic benzoate catabolism transcriptional regulator [Streptomyces turgidiscabies]